MTAVEPLRLSLAPYPGLRPFLRTEADIFFGREEQTDQLLKKIQTSRFLSVIGVSGCGKSSLVSAGMISALAAGFLTEAGGCWRIAEMRPGERPLGRLAEALTAPLALGPEVGSATDTAAFLQATLQRGPLGLLEVIHETPLPEHTNLLLLVDQFEEIFRFREEGDPDEANAFVALLLATARQCEVPIYIVITMRSEYLGQCALFAGLPEAMNESQFLTPRLTREQSDAAIAKPARVFGGRVDPVLVNRLLNDMGSDPNQLPPLQHCLMRMWTRVSQSRSATQSAELSGKSPAAGAPETNPVTITLDDYLAVGTLDQALSTHADEVLKGLTSEQQRIAQVMFRRLTERSSGGQERRHPARLGAIAKVAGVGTDEVAAVVEEFRRPDRSFVTPPSGVMLRPETVLDISHESLINLWNTLDEWVGKEALSAATYERLKQTAHLWAKEDADLWGAINLQRGLAWKEEQQPTVEWALRYGTKEDFASAMAFLAASEREWMDTQLRLKKGEERRQEEAIERRSLEERVRAAKRFKKLSVGLVVVVLLAIATAVYAFRLRRIAEIQSREATKAQEAAEAREKEVRYLRLAQAAQAKEEQFRAQKANKDLSDALQKETDAVKRASDQAKIADLRTKEREQAEKRAEASDLTIKGQQSFDNRDYQSALKFFQGALVKYKEKNDLEKLGEAYVSIGGSYDRLGEYALALESYHQAATLLSKTHNNFGLGIALVNMGLDYQSLGNRDGAADLLSQGMPLLSEAEPGLRAKVLASAGAVFSVGDNGSKTTALKYLEEASKLFDESGDTEGLRNTLNSMARVHQALGNKTKAKELFDRAAQLPTSKRTR
jgi:tetratricopeptide (TPR) repeat protein